MKTLSTRERLRRANATLVLINLRIQAHRAAHPAGDGQQLSVLIEDIQYITDMHLDQEELHERAGGAVAS